MAPAAVVIAFRAAMEEMGLHTLDPILPDGDLHRIQVEGDRRGDRNGWYVLYPDPPASGAIGCWKRGVTGTWTETDPDRLTGFELAEIRRRADATRAARQREREILHEEARRRAQALWSTATPARPDHPYLARKRVAAGTARQRGNLLVLPLLDLKGKLWSLQFIGPDGTKKLLTGGRKRGNVIPVAGRMPGASRILLCEGWATGATLAEMDPAALVLAAVDAGNLLPVAVAARARWPRSEIVVCCDADEVGMEKGRAAAVAARAKVAFPTFPKGVDGSDYNDLANALQAVGA
jgi:putative DNA primase/helicase